LCRLDDQPFELVHRLLAVEPDRSGLHDGGPPPNRAKSYGDERRSVARSYAKERCIVDSRSRASSSAWLRSGSPCCGGWGSFDSTRTDFNVLQGLKLKRVHERRTPRPYLLRGLLRRGMCERRMQGNWNHEEAYYCCRYPQEYAFPDTLEHPRVVYLRESHVIPHLDKWISTLFDPENVDETYLALAEAQESNAQDDSRIAGVREILSDCDARLARYRQALEVGCGSHCRREVDRRRSIRATKGRRRTPPARSAIDPNPRRHCGAGGESRRYRRSSGGRRTADEARSLREHGPEPHL
jgi:hypothetical protein